MGFDFDLSLHAVLRYMERHPDIDFDGAVDIMGYKEDEFLSSSYAEDLRQLVREAEPAGLRDGQMHLRSQGWVFVVDMEQSLIVTCYPA